MRAAPTPTRTFKTPPPPAPTPTRLEPSRAESSSELTQFRYSKAALAAEEFASAREDTLPRAQVSARKEAAASLEG
ncbi:hypothetical protein BD626DRAFT_562708 [Schizophyllum amplum]|uniref:Uncharacterized protein n=1 Tax=Schizophyllum amplum TaxID=97359 RepID=A0A550CVR5_9AGAR|nr:hypothetical protein BD626DRAFT_562708 [Auriculariopsis ampla]